MRWVRRTGAAIVVALLVVLIPLPGGDTPASALGEVVPPVDPYPVLPSATVKGGGAGVLDGSKSWAQAWAEVQKTAVKSGKPVASPLTQANSIVRNAKVGLNGNVLVTGFVAGFTVGSTGLRVWASIPGNEALPGVCGSGLEGISSLIYPDLMPDCSIPYTASQMNSDVTAVPPGWTAAPMVTFPAGQYGAWGEWSSAGMRVADMTGPPLPSMTGGPLSWSWQSSYVGTLSQNGYMPTLGMTLALQRHKVSDGKWSSFASFGANVAKDGLGYNLAPLVPSYQLAAGATYTIAPNVGTYDGAHDAYRIAVYDPVKKMDVAYWYPEGYPNRPVGQSGDPLRDAKCRITMDDGSVREGFVGQYRESEGFPMGAVAAACTDAMGNAVAQGLLPETIELTSTNTDTGDEATIATQEVPHFSESEKVGLTPGDNTGLRLLKVVNGVTQSCMTWEASCVGWWPKTSSGTSGDTDEGKYRCEYGGREVGLSECGVYRYTFDAKTESPTVTDPVTGTQTGWSATPDRANEYGNGAQSNQSNDRCVVSFSFNPVDWVLRPLRCAFEPRQSKIEQAKARMNAAWLGSGIGGLLVSLGGFVDTFNGAQGCGGLPLHLEGFGVTLVDTRLLAACDEPAKGIAATVRSVLTVGIIGGGLLASIRYLGSVFGFAAFGRINNGSNSGGSKVHFE